MLMHSKGDRLIHDDVLATGGTAKAVCELVRYRSGEVCNFIMELLSERKRQN
jgi:adenine phosphoribosyltransferase